MLARVSSVMKNIYLLTNLERAFNATLCIVDFFEGEKNLCIVLINTVSFVNSQCGFCTHRFDLNTALNVITL